MLTEEQNGKEKEEPTLVKRGVFDIVLDSKYPLLQDFREKCPGTFKHSQSLASVIEGISLSLGLDEDLMKTAALYHDVGKMFNPKYFTENQPEEENPHDDITPESSYEIITRHVSDSAVVLLNDHNFPREVIEIISQHHGTTILRYFFNKSGAKEADRYRYKTKRPASVEAMVLMICDHTEAMARSFIQGGKYNPKKVLEDSIQALIDDGQLDNVTIKLGDLKKMKVTLEKELEGLYQKRVDYDKVEKKESVEEENGE